MQNAGLQYVEGVTPVPESPFGVTQMQNNNTSSSTSSLRQFRKKDNVDKPPGAAGAHSASSSRADSLSSSHVARVAPHNHYPPKQNEYFRYPPYQEYGSPYKEHTVKYSEIAEPVPQAIPHLEHLPSSVLSKHKEKDYAELCNIPQQPHLNKPFSDHQFNGQQGYPTEMALHHQYMQKEPQGPQMHSPYKPDSQYIPKEGTFNHQISPFLKYNIPPQSRNYGHLENTSLGSFQRMDSHIARSLMSDHSHIRDFPADYGAMEQGRMYAQKQRYYSAPMPPSNPTYPPNYPHRNIPTQQYNYPNCNYPRTAQVNSSMGRYPINMDRSMSPRRSYPENLDIGMNYSSVPQKISSAYPNYPAYAQHYQHRRPPAAPQEYYHHQQHPHTRPHPQYMPTHHPQEVGENHVASNNIRQYLENWAEEESTTEISQQIENPKYIPRINRDEANEVYVINASELPQYLENGVPLVTSENGQYIFKSNVSIDNTGAIKILEKTVENAVLPTDAQERVVSLHIIENPKGDCLINTRTTNINQEHAGSANQVPAATINVITSNTSHSNQEHTVQQSYNLATSAFNANNRINLMHHVTPINQSGPQHNQNYENSVDLCLHNNMHVENNSPQEPILSNNTSLDNTIRLSPQIRPVEKSSELCQKLQNNAVSDENSLEKNRLKIQVLSYQEVPQNSCIVMPSTQSRLNFDESLLSNQVPSDAKGAKNDFEARNDHDEASTISNAITNNDNILNEDHEELDKIVEDTLTSSNINIPLVSCERNDLSKIQDKFDNSRIPDDLNLDLESNPKDSSNTGSDYTIENSCNNQNEDIIDLSTSRRGSSNDSEEQSIKLAISMSSEHHKLEQIVQEAHNNISILNEFSSSNNESITTDIKTEKEDGASSKSSMKHMPLIEDNSETRSSAAPLESPVPSDIMIEQKHSSDDRKTIDQCKGEEISAVNIDLEKKESEENDLSLVAEIPITQSEICDTNILEDLPQSENIRDDERTTSIDTSIEAKLSEIVGEPYELSDKPSYHEPAEIQMEEKRIDEDVIENNENVENKTETEHHVDVNLNSSLEELSSKNANSIEEPDVVLCEEPAGIIENINENPPQIISGDSSLKKAKEGSRKRRIFSVDDIIYRIGPTTVQNRRDSMHSIPDSDCSHEILLEEGKPQDNSLHISNKVTDSNVIEKKEESFTSLESTDKILMGCKKSEYDVPFYEINETSKKLKTMNTITESKSKLENKCSDNLSLIATSNESIKPCGEIISKGNTIINTNNEEKKLTNLEANVSIEKVNYSGSEEMIANMDTSEKDNVEEERSSLEENGEIETIHIIESVESKMRTHLVVPESVISVDRTFEFLSLLKANCPKQKTVNMTESEEVDAIYEKLPLFEQPYSKELETSKDQEKQSNAKGIYNKEEVGTASEIISKQHNKSDEVELFVSEHSAVNIDDNSVMVCSEVENDIQSCCNSSETTVASKLSNVEMDDQSATVCPKSVENTKKESENTPLDTTDASSDFKMGEDIINCCKTENVTEKSLHAVNLSSGCRFSVIHKIDDTKRITHQEEIGFAENYDANMSKMLDFKQKTEKVQISEKKTDDLKLSTDKLMFSKEYMSSETIEKSDSTTSNHCSVIQSIECTIQQDGIKEKIIETVEKEIEENSKTIEDRKEFVHNTNESTSNDEITSLEVLKSDAASTAHDKFSDNNSPMSKTKDCGEDTSKTVEKSKSSISLKTEELTFEQKFVDPFCDKIEQNLEKIDDIDQKSPEEVLYRSVLKIEENNVLLEICGELVEIIVNHVNGKKVITVIPMSSSATVDFNDNYEHVDRSQLSEENENIAVIEDDRNQKEMPGNLEKSLEEYKSEYSTKENMSEYTKIIKYSEEDKTSNGCEFISSTLSESIDEIFEDVILNENEIIIGDESLEEEINLDLQSKGVLDDEGSTLKPTLCTKAAKKLYDDIALHMPTKTYSSLREFRRIKSKPESSTIDYNKNSNQSKGKRSSKRSVRISSRKRGVSEQNEVSQTALRELIERRKMRKEKIRLKYTQYAKQESKILPELIKTNSLSNENDEKKVSTVSSNVAQIESLPSNSGIKKVRSHHEIKGKEFKQKMHKYNAKIVKKAVERKNKISEQDYSGLLKQQISANLEIEKNKPEEKPTSTSVIVSSSISTLDASPKNFHEAGTSTPKEISKSPSSQEKSTKFPRISTPRDLSLTKNVNEHYLSRKDHSNLKKKLSIQEYNSRKRKSVDCKTPLPEKCLKSTDEVANDSREDIIGEVVKPSTIYSDKQFECFPNSVKDPRRRPHFVNVQSTKLQRTQSERLNKSQGISSSRIHKQNENFQLTNCKKLKDPLLNSNESSAEEVKNQKNYRSLLLGKLSVDTFTPKTTKISSRRKTVEVMYDGKFETTEISRKKVSFDDNVQINEINTTQSRTTSIKPETTNDCEVSSSCSDIVEEKIRENNTDLIKESIEELSDMKTIKTKSDEERKNDWEGSNSPKDSITDVFAASFLEKSKIESLKNKSKVKCIIDMSDFETSLVNNELKSPYGVCFNSNSSIYEDAGSLKDYKEAVDSKLNSLSIQIPKSPKTRILNEDDVLIHKFLRKEQLNPEEIKQIRRIIYLKKKIQQMTHQNTNTKSDSESYEVKKKFESSSQKDLKLQLKKIDGRPRKKKKRFRNLYSNSPETSENDVPGTAGEFSVYEGENMSGVKLIFRRKTELMHLQPVVKLQRCKYIECMAKKLKYE
ncbi:hypothetical protein WA026_011156 [Henosepilachna vigintioctopunctata]|uniref:C2H2-type domain-containing protein n=1 Tax=Henosepilachna vigintioctopunctata TaxID=420089 RepID=A0AAW1U7X2_9CUCU